MVAELVGTDAKFGVTLGDIMNDNLSLFSSLNRTVALIGIPWYNVIGNHDLNFEALDEHSDETFERIYGPRIIRTTTARCTYRAGQRGLVPRRGAQAIGLPRRVWQAAARLVKASSHVCRKIGWLC